MKTELLAPAGDIEAGYAAIFFGADAVYLGLKNFSARATAVNFSPEELDNFVGYAHSLSRKVYVTVNTLVQESELSSLLLTLDVCSNCHVDGIILQDLGVARIISEKYPELELHASTQMAVHNKEGALALQKLGFKRVVLARELSLSEINEIAAIPQLETEAFIHGALCYSYSGMCLFSSLESGRSANRGKCLYPCRAIFIGESGEKHYFSMKDMALQEQVLKLPVNSLKIEGRKKSALYVAAVTDYYRRILDGKEADEKRADNIKQIFSRPWCKFMLNGKNKNVVDRDFVGHRGLEIGKISRIAGNKMYFRSKYKICRHDGLQIDIEGREKPLGFSAQKLQVDGKNVYETLVDKEAMVVVPFESELLKKGQKIYLASSSEVKGSYDYKCPKEGEFAARQKVDVKVEVLADKVVASSKKYVSEIQGKFESAKDVLKTDEAIKTAFAKTGDTKLALGELSVENKAGLFVPVSLLNELRRDLYAKIEIVRKNGDLPGVFAPRKAVEPKWIVRTDDVNNLSAINLDEIAEIEFLLDTDTNVGDLQMLPKSKIRLVLPQVARNMRFWHERVENLLSAGYKKWTIGNWWGLDVLPEKGVDIAFDCGLYMMNSQAISLAKEMHVSRICLSVEDCFTNMQKLAKISPLAVVMPVYQDVPLFWSAVCVRDNDCANCKKDVKWMKFAKDGKTYWARSKNCQTMVMADTPICFAKEAKGVSADFYRADFCYKQYAANDVATIWQKIRNFEDISKCNKGNIGSSSL